MPPLHVLQVIHNAVQGTGGAEAEAGLGSAVDLHISSAASGPSEGPSYGTGAYVASSLAFRAATGLMTMPAGPLELFAAASGALPGGGGGVSLGQVEIEAGALHVSMVSGLFGDLRQPLRLSTLVFDHNATDAALRGAAAGANTTLTGLVTMHGAPDLAGISDVFLGTSPTQVEHPPEIPADPPRIPAQGVPSEDPRRPDAPSHIPAGKAPHVHLTTSRDAPTQSDADYLGGVAYGLGTYTPSVAVESAYALAVVTYAACLGDPSLDCQISTLLRLICHTLSLQVICH